MNPVLALTVTKQVVFLGVIQGLAIGILGIGIVLIYRSTRVINFAIVSLGALCSALLARFVVNWHIPYWPAMLATLLAGAVIGAGLEYGVVRPLADKPRVVLFVATIGLGEVLLFALALLPKIASYSGYPTPWSSEYHVLGLAIRSEHILVLIAIPLLGVGLGWFLNRTKRGLSIGAAAANPQAARLAGISVANASTLVWSIAGALGALSAILVTPLSAGNAADVGTFGPALLLRGIVAALIGRMQSMPKAVAGGVAIGIAQAIIYYNYPSQQGMLDAALFVLVLLLLLFSALRERASNPVVEGWSFIPTVRPVPPQLEGAWFVRHSTWSVRVLAITAGVAFPLIWTHPSQQLLFSRVLIYALIALSLTVLTGWTGQLSLGQFAITGLSAMSAAWCVRQGINYGVALIAVTIVGMVAAAVIGAPALRLRGLFLAVITLAFAVATPAWLLTRHVLLPNGIDVEIPRGSILGFNLTSERSFYYLCLIALVLCALFIGRLRGRGVGRSFIAVRENEIAASALALSPTRVKLVAFVLAGGLAGLAGGLLGGLLTDFGPERFGVQESLLVVAIAVIGGIASVPGAVLGALWVIGLPALWPNNPNVALLVSGGVLVQILLFFPGGFAQILTTVRDVTYEQLARRRPARRPAVPSAPRTVPKHIRERAAGAELQTDRAALRVSHVTVRFSTRVVVADVALELAPDEIVGLIGANGAGKSTLMNAIGGYLPSTGTVELDGRDLSSLSATRRAAAGLGRSFQHARLFPDLTARETIQVALEHRHHVGPISAGLSLPRARRAERATRAEADEIIAFLGVSAYANRFINELSTGTRRIIELACMLAVAPRVLCLDEPTAGIAQRESEAFAPLIVEVRRELSASLLIIEHDMPLVMSISDRVYCLESGQVIAHGPPEQVRTDPLVIASYLGTDEAAIARSGHGTATTA